MKISKQILAIVEADKPSTLSDSELKKFWKDMQENVFKYSKNVVKNDLGLFYDNTNISFAAISATKNIDDDYEFDSDFVRKPQNYVNELELTSASPKEIISIILNEKTLSRESTPEEDEQAFQYFLKNLKNEKVCFYGTTKAKAGSEDNEIEVELRYSGHAKILNFKYDEREEVLTVNKYDITDMDTNEI